MTQAIRTGHVKAETHRGITTIEFFHPQSNSLPAWILHDLTVAIKHAGDDPDTRVIILRSGGERTFCAGASFDELMEITNAAEGLQFFSGFANVINAMRTWNARHLSEGVDAIDAEVAVGFAFLKERFATRVRRDALNRQIDVGLLSGPFKKLENRWRFLDAGHGCTRFRGACHRAARAR